MSHQLVPADRSNSTSSPTRSDPCNVSAKPGADDRGSQQNSHVFVFLRFVAGTAKKLYIVAATVRYSSGHERHVDRRPTRATDPAKPAFQRAICAVCIEDKIFPKTNSFVDVEDQVAGVGDIFGIVDNDEVIHAERRYLPAKGKAARAIVLAASRGTLLAPLTEDRPECMIDVRGEPVLRRLVRSLKSAGAGDITVVAGYKPEAIDLDAIRKVVNPDYATTGEVASLATALDQFVGDCVVAYGDIVFRDFIAQLLIQSDHDITIVVDAGLHSSREVTGLARDLVRCNARFTGDPLDKSPVLLSRISRDIDRAGAMGEWIAMARFQGRGTDLARREIEAMGKDGVIGYAGMPELLNRLVERGAAVEVGYVVGHWLNVNDAYDLANAWNFL